MWIRRHLLVALLGLTSAAQAQDDESPRRAILDASRALQAGNATRFLAYFDKQHFVGFFDLRQKVSALLAARTVASSVDVVSIGNGTDKKTAEVDWIMQLTPISGPGDVETRRQTIELTLVQRASGEWRIAAFTPIEFFRVL